ncbi:hypothetical protein AJ80_09378 [Polytolypa hystricis UAMH7299]|uniref:Mid2 domain-containing protein n=1 Tax=Polytolypa hystricis (strain UAMH7299) TaxID=1447883 RepID=A0A2B7WS02_POLH7|nr:hypothetical protein AJ80_09378 [Polytolypa hystricis UAMH7299]
MRQRRHPSSTVIAVFTALLYPLTTQAFPFSSDFARHALQIRQNCENPCGFYGQICCTSSQECYTDNNGQAACRDAVAQGQSEGEWEFFTTTYVQTDLVTVTSTGSRLIAAPTSGNKAQCQASLGQTECGDICCSAAQACSKDGKCVEGGGTPFETIPGPTATPPVRPTSSGEATVTATPTTADFIPPVSPDGSSIEPEPSKDGGGGLSGGAIAGIVIGVIAGVIFLLLLCLSACAKGLIASILAIFGMGKKKKRASYTGSHYSRHSHHTHRPWYSGGGGAPPPKPPSSKSDKKHGFLGLGKWATIGVLLGALAICLGLRRKKDNSEKSHSYYTGSSYSYGYSDSSSSSTLAEEDGTLQDHMNIHVREDD